jgi:peptidoglycan hydrolase CwlO-like protein
MITLLLLAQITRDEFMDFKRQVEVQFAEIKGEIKELRSQIQALNQRINDLDKRIDDLDKRIDDLGKDNENIRNDIRNQMIFFGTLFVGILGVLITFLISWLNFVKDYKEKKADKELVVKLEEKFKNLEEENKRLRNQNQVLINIIEKIVNGSSKEEIKAEIELIKKL